MPSLAPGPTTSVSTSLGALVVACSVGLISACAPDQPVAASSAVGPAPSAVRSGSSDGVLKVFSALDYRGSPQGQNAYHSGYALLSADGKYLRSIANRAAGSVEEAEAVALLPGMYKIKARAGGFGTVTVPVVIEAGKMTSVHLDGSEPFGDSRPGEAQFVSLSDDLIIGWSAGRQN
jgi:hypothetical protein